MRLDGCDVITGLSRGVVWFAIITERPSLFLQNDYGKYALLDYCAWPSLSIVQRQTRFIFGRGQLTLQKQICDISRPMVFTCEVHESSAQWVLMCRRVSYMPLVLPKSVLRPHLREDWYERTFSEMLDPLEHKFFYTICHRISRYACQRFVGIETGGGIRIPRKRTRITAQF